MESKGFCTRIEKPNKLWLARFLKMIPSTNRGGIDLVCEDIAIELKCKDVYWPHKFPCAEYQYREFPGRYTQQELYWAFLEYSLSKRPKEIRGSNLERYIVNRRVKFVPWNFVEGIKLTTPESGPWRHVSWDDLPTDDSFTLYESGKTRLYLPIGSSLEERVEKRDKIVTRHCGNAKVVTYE